jgi:hypothetical protein
MRWDHFDWSQGRRDTRRIIHKRQRTRELAGLTEYRRTADPETATASTPVSDVPVRTQRVSPGWPPTGISSRGRSCRRDPSHGVRCG